MTGSGRLGRTKPHPVLKEPSPDLEKFQPEHGVGGEPQRPGRGAPGGAEAHRRGLGIIANFRSPLPHMPTAHAPHPASEERKGRPIRFLTRTGIASPGLASVRPAFSMMAALLRPRTRAAGAGRGAPGARGLADESPGSECSFATRVPKARLAAITSAELASLTTRSTRGSAIRGYPRA